MENKRIVYIKIKGFPTQPFLLNEKECEELRNSEGIKYHIGAIQDL